MNNMTRREALKLIYRAMMAAGVASFMTFEELLAANDKAKDDRPNIIWLHGTSCSGCSVSFLNTEFVSVLDILTKFTNLIFHPDVSLATGDQVVEIIEKLASSGKPYVFAIEGGIPVSMPHACMLGDHPITHWVDLLASNSVANLALGTCATMGGITRMVGMERVGSKTLGEYLQSVGINKPLVNLPNCPMKPEHLVYTLMYYVTKGKFPELDESLRPKKFFGDTVHEKCIYYADFQEKRFAKHIGDAGCLLKLGCQGPVTYNDCLVSGHNSNTNVCIRSGHPCIGCTSEHFPRQIMFHEYGDPRAIQKDFKTT